MKKIIQKLDNNYPKTFEVIRFILIGGMATIIDLLVMSLVIFLCNRSVYGREFVLVFFTKGQASTWSVVLGTGIGFIVGLIYNYYFSINYVYKGENKNAKTKKGFITFLLLSLIGLVIQLIGSFIGYGIFKINEWLVKIVLIFVVLIFNYLTRKRFIFNENEKTIEIIKEKEELTKQERKKLTKTIFFILFLINFSVSLINFDVLNGCQWEYFFGSDSPRIRDNWLSKTSNHYRTKVHPLYSILIYPIFKILTTLGLTVTISGTLFISATITLCEILLYKTMRDLHVKNSEFYTILFTVIYSVCFSTIENLLIFESFAIASLTLLIFINWMVNNYQKELKLRDYIVLAVLGVLCFSMVLTNIIIYFVGIVCLLFNKKKKPWEYIYDFLKLLFTCVVSLIMSYILSRIQSKIFYNAENAFTYTKQMISDIIHGTNTSEEFSYMSSFGISSIVNVFFGFFGFTFCGGNLKYDNSQCYFDINILSIIVSLIVFSLLIVSLILAIKNKKYIVFPLLLSYLSQLVLHLFYGNNEIMLYSFQSLFLVFLIMCCGLPYIKEKYQKWLKYLLFALLGLVFVGSCINILKLLYGVLLKFGRGELSLLFNYWFMLRILIIVILYLTAVKLFSIYKDKNNIQSINNEEKNKLHLRVKCIVLSAMLVFSYFRPTFSTSANSSTEEQKESQAEYILFGMGQREKFVMKIEDGIGDFCKYNVKTKEFTPLYEDISDIKYDAENYVITGSNFENYYRFYEDEEGIYAVVNNKTTALDLSNHINIPSFKEYSHMRELKILFHEVLVNALPDGLTPNYLTYGNVWYRDSAIMAMVFEKTNNTSQVKITANKNDVYDNARGG